MACSLGIVTGLQEEAALLMAGPVGGLADVRVLCHGMGPKRAGRAAQALLEAGCTALMSFGIAGGLDPALGPGALVLAERVREQDQPHHAVDAAWRARLVAVLTAAGQGAHGGCLTGSARVVMTPAAKTALGRAQDAVAVDMESDAVAIAAHGAGVPFLVVRAVSDPATAAIPKAVLGGVDREGYRRVPAVVRSLAKRPWDLPGLLRLRRDTGVALATLGRVAAATGGRFAVDQIAG